MKPSPQEVEWQALEFGVIIHFGTSTFLDREWGDGTADPKIFAPTQFDPEQWMHAGGAGANVVLVAKHDDGFCLWPTEQKNYTVKNSQWENGRDRLPPVTTSRERLNILESSAQLHVREFQVFSIGKN